MPVVFIPGKGNVRFPDDMTPYQIQLAIEREILPGKKPETISAPKAPEATIGSFLRGAGENLKLGLQNVREAAQKITPGELIESGLTTAGQILTAPQVLQNRLFEAAGLREKAPPPPPPPGPRVSQIIDQALGLGSPEDRARRAAEQARRAAAYGPVATRTAGEQRRLSQQTTAELARPEFESILGEGLYSTASSLAQMAPGVAASLLTRSATPALASAGLLSATDQYFNVLDRGGAKEEAMQAAQLTGATEVATEILPMGVVVKNLGKAGVGKFLRDYLGKDLPTEMVATITQNAIDTAIANPDKTWAEYFNELPRDLGVTAISTIGTGAGLAGAGKGLQLASRLAERGAPEDEIAAALQGVSTEAAAPRTAPRPPSPPADMGALSKALGPVGGKVTLQEPSGPQEYTYQGLDEDGSVLLADADGQVFAEDPDQIAAAMQVGAAESEEGVGALAFGMDITEGLPPVEESRAEAAPTAAPEPAIEVAPEPVAEPTPATTGAELPLAEGIPEQLKAMERSNTPAVMSSLEKEARQIAADEGAESVSTEHFSRALNNAATRTAGTDVPFAGDWQQATRPAPAPERVRTVTTPGGSKVNTAFEVVDAKDLTAATGDLQNRDRSRAATDLQVQDIFSNFDPERLGESLESDRGSPIIGPDNVVESGNGRVMAINKVYNESPERADAYRKFIEAQGFDTSGIDRPVLVRRRIDNLTPAARAKFVRESNMDTKLQLSTSERAQTDAASLTPDVMGMMASPDVSVAANQDFVRAFLSKLPAQEQAAFLDKDGRLSAEGLRRLRTAVKASAYGDADLINTLDESQDNNIKSIGGALEDVAPAWRRFRDAVQAGDVTPEMDVTENLVDAAKIVRDVRNQGMKINDFLAQQDAFNPLDPVTERFIRSFYNQKSGRASGREAISDVLEKYARRASEQTTTEGLFEREAMSPADILDGIMEGAEQGGLFNNGKGVQNNEQVMEVLNTGTPDQMKNAIAQAQKPDDKIIKEGANLQKKNRGCD